MDALTAFLDGPRARGAFVLRLLLDPPFSIRVEDRATLSVVVVVRGGTVLVPDDGAPEHLGSGDVAVVRGPDPYTIADGPGTEPTIVVHPGQRCTTPDGGVDLTDAMHLGVRTCGNSTAGATTMLVGTYESSGEVSRRLLDALPPRLVLRAGEYRRSLVPVLVEEVARDEPGQDVVLDRLLDLLLIGVLRAWFTRQEDEAPSWFRAHGDPVAGTALRLLHTDPAHPWTVAGLAAEVGVSRAALARRFTDAVGEPPMTFLTNWRLDLAADLLLEPGATVDAVARRVGYGSAFALSTAFKRVRGISPRQHREVRDHGEHHDSRERLALR